ncbi:MAG: tetratricopeptide repeat protein [Pontiella sp.]
MSDENKDNPQEQQDFLSSHEELLNSINKGKKEPEPVKQPLEEPITEVQPVIEPEPIAEPEIAVEPEPIIEAEPVVESTPTFEPEPEPVVAPKPEPAVTPAPAAESAKATPAKSGKKKNKHTKHSHHTERSEEEERRHEELLKHQALENSEVTEVLNFFQKYAKPTAIIIIGICALVLVNTFIKNSRVKKEALADSALLRAQSATDYQDILDDYGSTPSAPLALMGLAQESFNLGQIDKADEIYGTFIKKYPKHEMSVQAAFNQITCKEAKGQFGEAHLLYGEFANKNKASHLAPVALLGKARCLEATDMLAEAKLVYEDIITFYPESGWSRIAESNLSILQKN